MFAVWAPVCIINTMPRNPSDMRGGMSTQGASLRKRLASRIPQRGQIIFYGTFAALFGALCLAILFFTPPLAAVRYPQVFIASSGETVRAVAEDLRRRELINSPSLFILSNHLFGEKIIWGSYHFMKPRGLFFHARDLYLGDRNMPLRKVRVPERSNAYHMADIFEKEFENFNREEFLELALEHHGYLYPDTYLFAHDYISADHLIEVMTETFNQRTEDLFAAYTGDLTQGEIVSLASIVDLEASRYKDRRKIAQVLFNRLAINMRLEVDVSFLFISNKHTFQLSREDLNSDDPSNTYMYGGIPPIPITNPSRESIQAVIDPDETDALFFLADFYGNTYYSKTYAEHLRKKAKYIDAPLRRRRNQAAQNATTTENEPQPAAGSSPDSTAEQSDTSSNAAPESDTENSAEDS